VTIDQRGWDRFVDGDRDGDTWIDIGAYETPDAIMVTSSGDEDDGDYSYGDLTLREALSIAANATGDDVIEFDESTWGDTITLAQVLGELDIDSSVDILGPGAANLTIDADGNSHVFAQTAGNTSSISGLTITGGSDLYGGGIYAAGTLTLEDAVVTDNSSAHGGGIYSTGDLTLNAVTVSDNGHSNGYGGGIYNASGDLTVTDSVISGNDASDGGGIYDYSSGDLAISGTTISDNEAVVLAGGLYSYGGTAAITSSTLRGNLAGMGGGIFAANGQLDLANVTISGNTATSNPGWGGGVYNAATLLATNVTVSGNTAGSDGGGIYASGGSTTLHNTIVAGNELTGGAADDVYGTFQSASSHNLIGAIDGSSNLTGNNTQYGTTASPLDARVSSLGDFGGLTLTHALMWDSPAIDAGSNDEADDADLETDQRGRDRFANDLVDVGAFELV